MAKLFGRSYVRVDGRTYDTEKGSSLEVGGIKREPRPGAWSAGGFTEEIVPSTLECKILLGAGVSVVDINKIAGAVVQFECDTGQTYIVRDAYSAEPCKLVDAEAVGVKFHGSPAEEML